MCKKNRAHVRLRILTIKCFDKSYLSLYIYIYKEDSACAIKLNTTNQPTNQPTIYRHALSWLPFLFLHFYFGRRTLQKLIRIIGIGSWNPLQEWTVCNCYYISTWRTDAINVVVRSYQPLTYLLDNTSTFLFVGKRSKSKWTWKYVMFWLGLIDKNNQMKRIKV